MIEVSPGSASDAGGQVTARGWLVRLLSDRHIRVAAAILMLGGGITITRSAYAQDFSKLRRKVQGGPETMSSQWQFRGIVRI